MPSVKLIFLTMHEDPDLAVEVMHLGASGFLLKTSSPSELIHAIREALRGRSYIARKIVRGMRKSLKRDPRGSLRPQSLTSRQYEVVQLPAEGKSMKEIGDILHVTERTVGFHKYQIREHLAISSDAELIQFAISNNIVLQ